LRYFHTATRIQPGRLDVCEKYQNIQAGLGQLAEYGFSEPLCKELQAKVESQVGLLSEHFDERALVHGDFTVDNVLVDEKKVTVLDIDGRYQNLIYHDVGSFLNSIGLATLGFPVRESTIRACNRAFLSGYFEYREYNYNTLWLLRASGLIAVTLEVLRRHLHQPPVKLWLSIYFARKFRRLVSEAPVS
jgi:Ser/Thr protein kinase RdoA (MazF antagonist)